MALKISDLVLMSDVDGTILKHGYDIPKRNLDAIRRFTQKGGRFGMATGRSTYYSDVLADKLGVNFPCVLFNGGVLFDYESNEFLWELILPQHAMDHFRELMRVFPEIPALMVNRDYYYDLNEKARYQDLTPGTYNNFIRESVPDEMEGDFYKGLFYLQDHVKEAFFSYCAERSFQDIRFVLSGPNFCEMIPEQSSKGFALLQLMKLKNFSRSSLIAIGDYYNDLEMLQLASISATLPGAPKELTDHADLVVCSCLDGAVADLIEHLEQRFPE